MKVVTAKPSVVALALFIPLCLTALALGDVDKVWAMLTLGMAATLVVGFALGQAQERAMPSGRPQGYTDDHGTHTR